jgi:hypothetical protein
VSTIFNGSKMRVLDDDTEDVGVETVDESFARLGVEGQRREPVDRGGDRLRFVGEIPTVDLRSLVLLFRGAAAVADAGSVCQQIADRDLALRRNYRRRRSRNRTRRWRDSHSRLLEARNELRHCIAQANPALLHKHDGDAGHRLRHRRDAEDRVLLHRGVGLDVPFAVRRQLGHLAASDDNRDQTRNAVLVDVLLHHRVKTLEPRR